MKARIQTIISFLLLASALSLYHSVTLRVGNNTTFGVCLRPAITLS